MRVLAFDPGAERCGYAILESGPIWHDSGIMGVKRAKDEPYQLYRLRLIEFWTQEAPDLLKRGRPEVVVSEIVPVVGGGNFVAAAQSQLAATAITVIHAMSYGAGFRVAQIAANTVKSKIGRNKDATKVKVRNGVFGLLPATKVRADEWRHTKAFDEADALAVGLAYLGYVNKEKDEDKGTKKRKVKTVGN